MVLGTSIKPAIFKRMPVKVHRMIVHAEVPHDEPVSLAALQDGLIGVGIRFAVDPPKFFVSVALKFGVEISSMRVTSSPTGLPG
jgi:hypothetical protein